jgi:hypothetical protein
MDDDILTLTSTMLSTYTLGLDPDASKSTSAFNSANTTFATAVASGKPKDGTRVYLGADDPYSKFAAGNIVIYDLVNNKWNLYSGPVTITGNEA